jgi:hypothetical protein
MQSVKGCASGLVLLEQKNQDCDKKGRMAEIKISR